MRKIFIIDTCVLLYDKNAIHSFPGNDVIIPLVVLDELDRFKDKPGVVGENARYVNRYLDDLRKLGKLYKGIKIENDQTIRVELEKSLDYLPDGLDKSNADNKIISLALKLIKENSNKPDVKITLVTKDINFRVKCDALGIVSEDYYKDRVVVKEESFYKGYSDIATDDPNTIDLLYDLEDDEEDIKENKEITKRLEEYNDINFMENQFLCIKCGSKSFLGMYKEGVIEKIKQDKDLNSTFVGGSSRNREQLYAMNALSDENIPIVTITGLAGSGKTYITLMTALSGISTGRYSRIVITRNVQPVGKDIGFLPGNKDEKMMPWMAPIMDNFRECLKDKDLTWFNAMREKGDIEIAPLAFMRGRTFNNTLLIMDEAQNATIHELKTVITRIGEGSKIVLLGDIDQIDTPYIDLFSNGLTIVAEKFKNEKISAHIQLVRGERSNVATIASKIL